MTHTDKNGYEDVERFHGHRCPGLAIGIRASELALKKLGHGDGDEELVCISETDMCGVDAIQYMTNCTLGKGNLVLHHYGKIAFTFYRRSDGKGIRMVLKAGLNRNMDRERYRLFLLEAPLEELFAIGEPREPLPPKAFRENTLICAGCGEGTMESMTRNMDGKVYCLPCYSERHGER